MVLRNLAVVALLASCSSAVAQESQPFNGATLHRWVGAPRSAVISLNLPAAFPLPATSFELLFECLGDRSAPTSGVGPLRDLDRWQEWVDIFEPAISEHTFDVQGYVLACDDQWFYAAAPILQELAMFDTSDYGLVLDGGTPFGLVMPLPFSERLRGSSSAHLQLDQALTVRLLAMDHRFEYVEIEDVGVATTADVVIAVRQSGPLQPLLYQQQLHPVTIDIKQPFDVYFFSGRNDNWRHAVLDVSESAVAFTSSDSPPAPEAMTTRSPAEIWASIMTSAAEPETTFDPSKLQRVEVGHGDTLWSIARRYNTTVERLVKANCLVRDTLQVGELLFIPDDDVSRSC